MNIPDEVWNAAYMAGDVAERNDFIWRGTRGSHDLRKSFLQAAAPVVAEWSRREALKEAAEAVHSQIVPRLSIDSMTEQYNYGVTNSEAAIRALVEGGSDE